MYLRINVIDLETFGKEELTPYCFSICYRNRLFTAYGIDCITKAIQWIFKNCETGSIFFAHNLNFDGSLIINKIPNNIYIESKGTILKGGDIYGICLSNGSKLIYFRCSAKILPMSLSSISDCFKLPKKLDIDHNTINNDNFMDVRNKITIIRYCERDVVIVHRFMTKIGDEVNKFLNNWHNVSYSISGLALKIFSNNFNNFKIPLKLKLEVDELVRPAYYGGRCEVFGNPECGEHIFHFDFSSMYTNRLKELFPYGDCKKVLKPENTEKPGFYSITVHSNLDLPILPYRHPYSGKLLFPNGYFSGIYWYEEIKLFLENGGKITKIHWGLEFEKTDYIFSKFAFACNEARFRTLVSKVIWKLIPNSFIGRLGLKPKYEKTIILDNEKYDPVKLDVIADKPINNQWIVRVKYFENIEYVTGNVIYPAIITSKARILWWKSAKEVTKNGGRILYCDTDSLFVSFKKNVIGETHGEVYWDPKKDDTVIEDACFATSKVYGVRFKNNNVIKIKGIPKKQINLDLNTFKNLFYNKKKEKIKMTFFNKNFLDMKINEINKIINFDGYDKRIFSNNKKFTQPLIINENTLYNK